MSPVRRALNYTLADGLGPFLLRALAGSGGVQMAGMLVTFLIGIQLARGLGVEGYGYYGIAMAIVVLASVPGEYGIPKLVIREVAAASTHADYPRMFGVLRWSDKAAFWLTGLILLAEIVLLLYVWSAGFSTLLAAILLGLPVVPIIAFARIRGAGLQGLHNVVLGQLPFTLLRPLLLSLLLFALFALEPDAGAPEAMALNVVTAFATLILAELWLRSRLKRRKPAQLLRADRQWLASSIPMALADGMRIGYLQFAILLLGMLSTPAEVGLFRIATSIAIIIAVPFALVSQVINPVLASLHTQKDVRRLQHLCTRAAQAIAAGVAALTLPFVLIGEPLIRFIFGEAFGFAYSSVLVLCAGQLLAACFGPSAMLLTMTGHERLVLRAMSLALGASVSVVLIAAPIWGSEGAALGAVSFYILWSALTWRDAKRLLGVETSLLPVR